MTAQRAKDRVTQFHVRGVRCLADVRLDLDGLRVLIGENGSGKSTLVEVCALLQRIGAQRFNNDFFQVHGGMASLLRRGAQSLVIAVRVAGAGEPLEYSFEMSAFRAGVSVESEELVRIALPTADPRHSVLRRNRADARIFRPGDPDVVLGPAAHELALSLPAARVAAEVARVLDALDAIEVHVAFAVRSAWVARESGFASPMRESKLVQPTFRLERLGSNLANAFWALRNDFGPSHWQETLELVQLGLGREIEDVVLSPDPGGGSIAIALRYRGLLGAVPANVLSDGALAFLALIAVYRLGSGRSLLVFDEPDLHLHPRLLRRVVSFFETLAEDHPVLLTTHSDALLDALAEPAKSVVLCDLDEHRATRLRSVDRSALDAWLDDYRGLGDVRGSGHEESVFED